MNFNSSKIMIVDDEEEIRDLFRNILESRGYEVMACEDGQSAIDALKKTPVFAAFVDIRMPGINGVETLKEIKAIRPDMHVIMITGYTRDRAVEEALRLGCFVCMMKPFKIQDIIGLIEVLETGLDTLAKAA